MMYDQDKDVFFSHHQSVLHDTFHLTQYLNKKLISLDSPVKDHSNSHKRQSISFLPRINKSKVSSPQLSLSLVYDSKDHVQRRKKENRHQGIKFHQSVAVSRYIENVTRQHQQKSQKKHDKRIQQLVDNIKSNKQNKANVNEYIENEKKTIKRINRDLGNVKIKNQALNKQLQILIQRRQNLKGSRQILNQRQDELKKYQTFYQNVFSQSNSNKQIQTLNGSQMIEQLYKIEQNCLGQSEHIKLIHLSNRKINKQIYGISQYLSPRMTFLKKQVQQLQGRYQSVLEDIEHLKIERMKRKNISNTRHPFYIIAPRVVEMGAKEMKYYSDPKDDAAPLLILRQLEIQMQQVLRTISLFRQNNETKIMRMETQLVKTQSHEAYKKDKIK